VSSPESPPPNAPDSPNPQIAPDDAWTLGGLRLTSRVLLGSAMYKSRDELAACVRASGTQLVTVSLRRVQPGAHAGNLYATLRELGVSILPNTAGCLTARDAVRTAQLGREALGTSLVKLEVVADDETLLPDGEQLLEAAEALVRDGFQVLPYTNDDVVLARKLVDVGCAAVMPLAAPIGTGLGIRDPHALQLIRRYCAVPILVDAGLGTAWHVTRAMELGVDGVLLNTAVAKAADPVRMARAVRAACEAGRDAFLAGPMPARFLGGPSSPMEGIPWRAP
jgi:thiazole synthase